MMTKHKINIDLNPALEQLKMLPGGQGIYDYAMNKHEQMMNAIDVATDDMIAKHELPDDPQILNRMGYILAAEVRKNNDQQEYRAVVLYKKVDETQVIL